MYRSPQFELVSCIVNAMTPTRDRSIARLHRRCSARREQRYLQRHPDFPIIHLARDRHDLEYVARVDRLPRWVGDSTVYEVLVYRPPLRFYRAWSRLLSHGDGVEMVPFRMETRTDLHLDLVLALEAPFVRMRDVYDGDLHQADEDKENDPSLARKKRRRYVHLRQKHVVVFSLGIKVTHI